MNGLPAGRTSGQDVDRHQVVDSDQYLEVGVADSAQLTRPTPATSTTPADLPALEIAA